MDRMGAASATRTALAPVMAAALAAGLALAPVVPASAGPTDDAPPAAVRVCRSAGGVDVVPFKQYVKEVLPREFPASWPTATLRAGAVAIRSFAWWHVRHPYSEACDLTDTTLHQRYDPDDPHNPPTARTDRAVEDTWWVLLRDGSSGRVTRAQYCGINCGAFPDGAHLDQHDARARGAAGWSFTDILEHAYAAVPATVEDWRAGLGVRIASPEPIPFDDRTPTVVRVRVDGVETDRSGAVVDLYAGCTIDGRLANHHLARGAVLAVRGGAGATFEGPAVHRCVEPEVALIAVLRINGHAAATASAGAWRPWVSQHPRPVERLAPTDDPVAAGVAISRGLFDDHGAGPGEGDVPDDPAPTVEASTAVIARDDVFADALAATGLIGTRGPILLTPGGRDGRLAGAVQQELDRILPAGSSVHIAGGEKAVGPAVERALRDELGYAVVRHAGRDRIETALLIAGWLHDRGLAPDVALLARAWPNSSRGWADAVTGGAYAATRHVPVVLTSPDGLDPRTERFLVERADHFTRVHVLGGTAAVHPDAEERLEGHVSVDRVAGPHRDATALAVLRWLWGTAAGADGDGVLVVDTWDDRDWPFALTSAVAAAATGRPQISTRRLVPRQTTGAWLDRHPGTPATVVGGTGVVAQRIVADLAGERIDG